MPALEMAQETGKLVRWLKREGEAVSKGEPIMEIETDKVTVEIEAPASGTLAGVQAREGDVTPVGQTIAWILAPGESLPPPLSQGQEVRAAPLARRIAEEHGLDLSLGKADSRRLEKADVLAYLALTPGPVPVGQDTDRSGGQGTRLP